jgi:crossover junction endodeoxyribonuclease RuvC
MFGGKMRILGIDPGLTRCGVGIIDTDARRQSTFVHVAVLTTPAESDLPSRLHQLEQALETVLETYIPDVIAIERVFSQHNVRTAMGTAQASAVGMLAATRRNIPVVMYTPTEVKAAVTGSGRANKDQVTAMVTRHLKLLTPPKPADAADALALALCHSWKGAGQQRLKDAMTRVKVGQL